MTDSQLTLVPGKGDEFYALSEHVPAGWQWRTKVTERWHVESLDPSLTGTVVICRERPKRWAVANMGGEVEGDRWQVFDGDRPTLTVEVVNGEGIARRVAAFLNHEDEFSQLVMSLARATRDPKTNLTPYVQEAVRLTAAAEGRTSSAIG